MQTRQTRDHVLNFHREGHQTRLASTEFYSCYNLVINWFLITATARIT